MTDEFDPTHLAVPMVGAAAVKLFMDEFIAKWLTPLADEDGYSEAETAAAEARLGVRLPSVLRATYRLCGRRDSLVRN